MAMDIDAVLKAMIAKKGSDLHVRPLGPVYARVDGILVPLDGYTVADNKEVEEMSEKIMTPRAKRIFENKAECDFSYSVEGIGRFRFNVFRQRGFYSMVARAVSSKIPTLEDLKLPVGVLQKMAMSHRGLILVTGVTGSGKSSTLAAMIGYINQNRNSHIITVEDPIEFLHVDNKSIISQREIGMDTMTFVDALKAAMRQNPDVILVGEMRDLETTQAALSAAQTGHLVLSTLHTIDAVQTVNRIIDLFPPHQQAQIRIQLAESLKGVVSQRLLPGIQGGRVPAVEVMAVTAHIKKLIEENKMGEMAQAIAKGSFYGMQTFNQSLVKLHKDGLAKLEDVLAAATNPDDVMLAIRGIEQAAGAGPK